MTVSDCWKSIWILFKNMIVETTFLLQLKNDGWKDSYLWKYSNEKYARASGQCKGDMLACVYPKSIL